MGIIDTSHAIPETPVSGRSVAAISPGITVDSRGIWGEWNSPTGLGFPAPDSLLDRMQHHLSQSVVMRIRPALVVGVGLVLAFWRRPNLFLHTWLHESAHALMCVVLFVRVGAFQATAGQGGEVRHEPVNLLRAIPILIAPYVLPMILGPILFARWLSPDGLLRSGLTFVCGIALFMHLHGLVLNLRFNTAGAAADIPRVGHLLAFALVATSLLLIASATVVVLWSTQPPAWWSGLFAG